METGEGPAVADVFKRTVRARVYTTKNEITRYDQEYLTSGVTFTEIAQQRTVLATNMTSPAELDMSNVGTAATVMLETDRAITVFLGTVSNSFTLGNTGMFMMVGSTTHIFVQNNSTTYTATVEWIVTN